MDRVLKSEISEKEDVPLPVLRDDLEIVPTAPQAHGAPAWVIFDPVAGRYFEIGRELLDMLTVWRMGTMEKLIRRVRTEFGRVVSEDEVGEAIHFLMSNALVRDIPNGDYKTMAEKQAAEKKSWLSTAIHSYLFFRIPLVRPDRFLRATYPFVAPLFSRGAVWLYVIVGLMGLYLASRQWDQFSGTFQFLLSWQGALIYGLSLVFVKSIHELGHAYMSVRYGLRVPTIGIAFMVLMPVLYTDTSGAWRLRSRCKRLMIDGAGIFTELVLAAIATLLWVFLPDGGLRLCVFAVATTSWITSLFVNLNPLMRFDGYYILSDLIGFQNMQQRGFDMAKWRLRELLFGLGEQPPEPLTPHLRRTIILHAWATWIYRFFLFLGIAVLVYTFFVKVVGIILFVIEIAWFIALPVWREITHWWSIKEKIMITKRFWVSSGVALALGLLAIIPWSTSITIPALMTAEQEQALFTPFPAQLKRIHVTDNQAVQAGDLLFELAAPEVAQQIALATERKELIESRINRTGSDSQDRASLVVLTNELREVNEELEGLSRVSEKLTIRAPFTGTVADIDPELHEGLWVNAKAPLAMVQSSGPPTIKGYVNERSVFRFEAGATAKFIPDSLELPSVKTTVTDIAEAGAEKLDQAYLALPYGGSIAVEEGDKDKLRPTEAAYAVAMIPSAEGVLVPQKAVRGVSVIEGAPESFFSRVKRQVLKVLVREMGV